jgi:mevalonate kinase
LFNQRIHGKWILAGEHSILRGGKALVFPVKTRYLDFNFNEDGDKLILNMNTDNPELVDTFWKVFDQALSALQVKRTDLKGVLSLKSNIPVGAGMGASATLCVGLAQFFKFQGYLEPQNLYMFAKSLENIFHGESSGIDIAVALHNQAIEFSRPDQVVFFKPKWEPLIYLSYCGKKGITSDCVKRVQELLKTNPEKGQKLDNQMQLAVEKTKAALLDPEKKSLLIEGINLALDCFINWDLLSQELHSHMSELRAHGALAVKPTGSGQGGFVLSLWDNDIAPKKLNLIKAY